MSTVADKLRIAAGSRVLVIDPAGRGAALLGPLPERAAFVEDAAGPDVTVLFVADEAALRRDLPVAAAAARGDRLLWVAYRKGGAKAGTDLDRDRLTVLADDIAGLTGVALVAVDATWSAMRLRPSGRYRS
jgi:hypothetical protein